MSVSSILGDVFSYVCKDNCPCIAHGCNCFNTWGSGVALQMKQHYPDAYNTDLSTSKGDTNKLGHITSTLCGDITVYNLYTQYAYGSQSQHTFYLPLYSALTEMHNDMKQHNYSCVAIPLIGCGTGGMTEEGLYNALYRVFTDIDVLVVRR